MFKSLINLWVVVCAGVMIASFGGQQNTLAHEDDTTALVAPDASGFVRTVNTNGPLDLNNPFFKSLGTNGRSCSSCHRPAQGWSMTPESVRQRFEDSRGLDPIFRANDGSNCAKRRHLHDREAKGRVQSALEQGPHSRRPRRADGLMRSSSIEQVDDPYGCGAPLTTSVAVPPPAAVDEPAVPERGHVGRPRIVRRRRAIAPGPRASGQRRDARARAGAHRT